MREQMTVATPTLLVRTGCEITYDVPSPTPAVLMVRPDDAAALHEERWHIEPATPLHAYRDVYGNTPQRLVMQPGPFTLRYDATVGVSPEPAATDPTARKLLVEELPDDTLLYVLPSRFCQSDQLGDIAWELFGDQPANWSCVQAVCDWVHAHITFQYGTSRPVTTALDVLDSRTGVCRDFAHLAVAFCRALNIPARYAFGYLPDIGVPRPDAPMDFCAWFEAYLGDRWWTFDPRNNQRRIGHITIGRGRDALDVAMVTTFGAGRLTSMTVWADQVQ